MKRTWIAPEDHAYPNGGQTRKGLAIFPDGSLRRVWGGIPDTFFSIPAHATVAGRYVAGTLYTGSQFEGPEREGELLFSPREKKATGYVEVDVIVDGALEATETFEETTDGAAKLDAFVETQRLSAESDGLPTEIFILAHPHPMDEEECACVQYETDHHPDYSWNVQ